MNKKKRELELKKLPAEAVCWSYKKERLSLLFAPHSHNETNKYKLPQKNRTQKFKNQKKKSQNFQPYDDSEKKIKIKTKQ